MSHLAGAVTPHATNPLPLNPCRGLWVGGAGNVSVRMTGGQNTETFSNVPAGTRLDIDIDRVFATGTTATLILALGE